MVACPERAAVEGAVFFPAKQNRLDVPLQAEPKVSLALDQPMIKRGLLNAKTKDDTYKLRWCVLHGVTFGTFVSRTDAKPHKVVSVYGAEVRAFKEPKRPFGMLLVTKAGQRYELAAESEMDRDDWMAKIAVSAASDPPVVCFQRLCRTWPSTAPRASTLARPRVAGAGVDPRRPCQRRRLAVQLRPRRRRGRARRRSLRRPVRFPPRRRE